MALIQKRKDPTRLICDFGELSGLFTDSTSLETFLQKLVEMIAHHMQSDVCSIYLYYDDTEQLELRATTGLNPQFIGNVKLKLGEGLTGLALKELRPICERHASQNPNFRYFPELGEEKFESFLAVPIIRGTVKIGVMVIQNTQRNYFSEEDIAILRAVTSQLANTIETTRLILSLEDKHKIGSKHAKKKDLKFVKGKGGSPGSVYGPVMIVGEGHWRENLSARVEGRYSLDDFYQAVHLTESQLESFQKQIEEKLSDVASLIFTAQILMLKDKGFIDGIVALIHEGINPPEAVKQIVESYVRKLELIANPYLREKSHDVWDIGNRLLENLIGTQKVYAFEDCIVIARELFPSDILKLSSQKVKGVIVLHGGVTGHLSILAQSLGIPLIIADATDLLSISPGTPALMDAEQGNIYVNPSPDIVKPFMEKENTALIFKELKEKIFSQTQTLDGVRVRLMANINLLGDLKIANSFQAEGIGLYRTEFPFIVRSNFPSEQEQYVIYKKLIDGMPNKEITFRTLDIGGDKELSYFQDHRKEDNPFLGLRSVRFSLKYTDIFAEQIRAILKAGCDAKIRIMFPMISSVDEFLEVKKMVKNCMCSLQTEKVAFNKNPKIGIMIELPSVLEVLDDLASEADFFCIGTNDFVQYLLAVDRTNEKVSDFYIPHQPSVLRALKRVMDKASQHKIDCSVCGDMVHNEKYLKFLLGIGVRNISLNPMYLPKIQKVIQEIHLKDAQEFAAQALGKSRLKDINKIFDF